MWKYTHTDEMYHSLTGRNDELFHSAVYLGQDFSDGIKHFKYIKREKINGKWVYTYRHDEYENAKTGYNNAKRQLETSSALAKKASDYEIDTWNAKNKAKGEAIEYNAKKIKSKRKLKELENKATLAKSKNDTARALYEAHDRQQKLDYVTKEHHREKFDKVAKKTAISRSVGTGVTKALNKASDARYKRKQKIAKKVNDIVSKIDKKKIDKWNNNKVVRKIDRALNGPSYYTLEKDPKTGKTKKKKHYN